MSLCLLHKTNNPSESSRVRKACVIKMKDLKMKERYRLECGTERLRWLDVVKGIGIILVVVGHIYSNRTVFNWLYSFHMPLFFIAAGLVYRKKPILVDIRRRIQSIVVPYFSLGGLLLIYWQLLERKFRDSDKSFANSFMGLFSGQYDNLDFNVHLWFLPCFFVTVVLYNILVNVGGKLATYIVVAMMSLSSILLSISGLPWGIDRAFYYIGFYAVGALGAENTKYVDIVNKKICRALIAVLLLAVNFTLSYYNQINGIMSWVTALIGVAGIVMLSCTINESKLLQYFGRISLIVLCIHGPVYRILVKLIAVSIRTSTDSVRENFLLAMFVVAITMAISSVAYEIAVRVAPWIVGKKKSTNVF